MYTQLRSMNMFDRVETLTRMLVGIKSINGTIGEVEIADFIKDVLLSFPYFQEHPENVWEQKIPNDSLGRKNIFALVRGLSDEKQTIIYHSHIDTVGIEDFGVMKQYALKPDELAEFFSGYERDKDVQKDAQSGDWLFGRGSVDMQSGIAVHLANVLYFTEHREELSGNVLLMLNPDEESQHKGVITAISELERLKRHQGLDFVMAINNDFITPLYDGDHHRYIYTGAAGKLLPSFYIYGREAHVGDTLSGIDPNVIAAEITRRIHNNVELTENIEGELVLPPSCLYQRDNKEVYNVQTATSSYLYFNYFIYELTAKEVMDKLKDIAVEATREVEEKLSRNYKEFLIRTGLPAKSLSWNIEVTSLAEYMEELAEKGMNPEQKAREVWEQNKDMEPRMLCFKIVEALQNMDSEKKARVIIFYAPPYLPHNYLNTDKERDRELLEAVREVLKAVEKETGEKFALKKFFPYLADGSFLSLHETDEEILSLIKNFPEWENIYPVPVNEIRSLNISSVNIGVYGKDGHKWTERVYKPYTFGVLPGLIRAVTCRLLSRKAEPVGSE
ncbi:M20/M25/M40 family metallo-hydrolase [Aneurinibacillus thermoaerophilus]|uniref:M20/M25/M40 family metallo-hydrolase n=1 Tax=Aneurinibacillus thermoaerophilus TaxID=143495 RepID=UPI002E1C9921|nr:M20/M25/M40 family metallo-hydrolase [Aneurinibacillus thermoaerophilus]MED0675307.1 M20/M25/M40 family metallo-hydrolase [Aneurinibacillus thermoaerophilus]MED0738312.1 M20/M25/M40 family metallo-hydrolase [Aneurinibacillus thermoaerophilus]